MVLSWSNTDNARCTRIFKSQILDKLRLQLMGFFPPFCFKVKTRLFSFDIEDWVNWTVMKKKEYLFMEHWSHLVYFLITSLTSIVCWLSHDVNTVFYMYSEGWFGNVTCQIVDLVHCILVIGFIFYTGSYKLLSLRF